MAEDKNRDYRNPQLQIRISPELDERLTQVSSMYGVSKGEIARIAIGQYVGQVTGMMERITQSQKVDYEKIVEIMTQKLLEAERSNEVKCKE